MIRCEIPSAEPGQRPLKLVGLDIRHAQREDLYQAIAEFKARSSCLSGRSVACVYDDVDHPASLHAYFVRHALRR